MIYIFINKILLQEKAVEATKQKKEERRKKPKPEEQEGKIKITK
jgi:hypothetical protein